MRIEIEYTAQLADAAGATGQTLTLPEGATLADLCRTLADAHGDALANTLGNAGTPHPWILTAVNDKATRDATHPLRDGDRVSFLSPISGG